MSKSKKHVITHTAGSIVFLWRCRSCREDNVSGVPAIPGYKTFVCSYCCDSLTVKLSVKQFAYHYSQA